MRSTNDGNVGIGTNAPSQNLEVLKHQDASTLLRINNGIAGISSRAGLQLTTSGSENGYVLMNSVNYTGVSDWADSLSIGVDSSVDGGVVLYSTDKVRIQNIAGTDVLTVVGGEVGIGTDTPDGLLNVFSGSAGTVTARPSGDDLVIEHSSSGGMSILTPNSSTGNIIFGSPTDPLGADLRWNLDGRKFTIGTRNVGSSLKFVSGGGVDALIIDENQNFDFQDGDLTTTGAILGGGAGHDQFSDFVANEHIDWTSASSNFLTTGTINLNGSGGLTEILSSSILEIRHSRDASAPIIDFRGLPLDTSSSAQFRFGLSSGSSGPNEITLIAPDSTTIASSIGTGFIDFNRNQADTDFSISSVNNLNMFYLDASTDRVGINKLSPAQTLDVVGSFAVSGTAATGALTTTGQATFSGNVGINTTTPQNELNVKGDINATGFYFGDGSQLTGIAGGEPLWNANYTTFLTHIDNTISNLVNYFTKAEILDFNYYNTTNFAINDYRTLTNNSFTNNIGLNDHNLLDVNNIGSTADEIDNIYIGTNQRIYFGDNQESSIYNNGTHSIWK